MANILSNEHIKTILNSKNQNLIDTYISLVESTLQNRGLFKLPSSCKYKSNLVKLVQDTYSSLCEKTIRNNLKELEKLDILSYLDDEERYYIKDLELSCSKNNENNYGYIPIIEFMLEEDFNSMSLPHKRLFFYLLTLTNSKNSYKDNRITINLKNSKKNWMKVLRTNFYAYAFKIIKSFILKYNKVLINYDNIDFFDIDCSSYHFTFTLLKFKELRFNLDSYKNRYNDNYNLLERYIKNYEVEINDRDKINLLRLIAGEKNYILITNFLTKILTKVKSEKYGEDNKIKSFIGYGMAVIKSLKNELYDLEDKILFFTDDEIEKYVSFN